MRFLVLGAAVLVCVHFGSAIAPAQGLPRLQRNPQLSMAANIANVGDIDLDGAEDYAIGSPGEGGQAVGRVRVCSARSASVIYTFAGASNNDRFGETVAGGGDLDADGIPDVLVGLPYTSNPTTSGHVRAYSGATGNLLWVATLGLVYGWSLARAGDVNGDGYDDVVTGSGYFALPPSAQPPAPLPVLVLSGLDGSVIRTISGATAAGGASWVGFGFSVGGGRDFDGDGFDDVLVGFPTATPAAPGGSLVLYSSGSPTIIRTFSGGPQYSYLGQSLAVLGDVDGDGIPEVVAGGQGALQVGVPGIVQVYSGATGTIRYTRTGSTTVYDAFGIVAAGADLDGDGAPDFATGTPQVNPSGPPVPSFYARGALLAWSGATGASIGVVGGPAQGSAYGRSFAMLADTNGDGIGEIGVVSGGVDLIQYLGGASYGAGNGSLQLAWIPGPAGLRAAGFVAATGASALAPGIVAVDVAPGSSVSGNPPFPVLLGVTPSLFLAPVTYDANGVWGSPLNLRQPALAGTVIYGQAFEGGAAGIIASPGLELLFSN